MITRERINSYFNKVAAVPAANVFCESGFTALAAWSERQPWWADFTHVYSLDADWRSTAMGDCYIFSINLFSFLNDRSPWRSQHAVLPTR